MGPIVVLGNDKIVLIYFVRVASFSVAVREGAFPRHILLLGLKSGVHHKVFPYNLLLLIRVSYFVLNKTLIPILLLKLNSSKDIM